MDKKTAIYSIFVMVIAFFMICVLNIFTGKSQIAFSYPIKAQNVQIIDDNKVLPSEQNQIERSPSTPQDENIVFVEESEAEAGVETGTEIGIEPVTEVEAEKNFSQIKIERDLYLGMVGDDVKKAQHLLKKVGYYNGEINGEFDDKTKRAVILFQKDYDISQTGNVGKLTRTSLEDINVEK
jgi:hypothetical protein